MLMLINQLMISEMNQHSNIVTMKSHFEKLKMLNTRKFLRKIYQKNFHLQSSFQIQNL